MTGVRGPFAGWIAIVACAACGGGAAVTDAGLDVAQDEAVEPAEAVAETEADSPGEVAVELPDVALVAPTCDFHITRAGKDVTDTNDVPYLSKLTLVDASAAAPGDEIDGWSWTLTTVPATNMQIFVPSPATQNPTYAVNNVGYYEFALSVTTKFGLKTSCSHHVGVPAPAGCHIELTWTTPADPNPYDECPPSQNCGSDMDLHFVSPGASGCGDIDGDGEPDGFFDKTYDCFWWHADPVWDTKKCSPDCQPHLDRDDTDTGGPEVIDWKVPTAGVCAKVGVHYFADHGFGRSYPTLAVWANGQPLWSKTIDAGMKNLEMWEAGTVCCADGTFQEAKTAQGNPVVVPNYYCPDFR